jgi:ferredoxin
MPYIVTSECILCGACVVGCESDAITEGETQSYINPELCVECGTCERNCPSEAIIYVEETESDAVLSPPVTASAQKNILNSSPGT